VDGRDKPGHDDGARLAVIARSASDEAIHPSVVPCDGLLRFARNDGNFTFVDGIFTSFVERPFTNASHATGQKRAISCV
jgi:hypothetical protein